MFNGRLPEGVRLIAGYFDPAAQARLLAEIEAVIAAAPLFTPAMPKTGKSFSVAMTNCGALGWVSDKAGGYRYQPRHPQTGVPWPAMPGTLLKLWDEIAAFNAPPEACLVNWYGAGAKLGSHRDSDEDEPRAPVVSVSLGDDAAFHVGGLGRRDLKTRMILRSGDVIVLGGPARLAYHGIDRIKPGTSDLLARGGRINLTLRRVTRYAG